MKIFRFLCRKEIAELERELEQAHEEREEAAYLISCLEAEKVKLEEENKAILARCNIFEHELRARPAINGDNNYMNALRVLQEYRAENTKLKETNWNLEQQIKKLNKKANRP